MEAALADCIVGIFSFVAIIVHAEDSSPFLSVRGRRISRAKQPRANFRFSREVEEDRSSERSGVSISRNNELFLF